MRLFEVSPLNEQAIGFAVFDQDDVQVGILAEIRSFYFRVAALADADFWLAKDYAGAVTGRRVRLSLTVKELPDYAIPDLKEFEAELTVLAA